jgi:dihydrofolate synthase/folylpolyglutamate synthase
MTTMDQDRYVSVLDRLYDLPTHILGRTEVFVPTPEQRLERIAIIREFLDRAIPGWRDINVVHVGGTSGKGSTAWMLAAMLSKRHRTGLVTSPHLFDVRERIRIDLEPIPREDLVRTFETRVEPVSRRLADEDPRFALRFPEVILACAFARFIEVGVDWAMVEVALGGRYDQSNVVVPRAVVITNVSFDHMHQLGETLEEIAGHKAGIIKEGVPAFTSETQEEVLRVLRDEAETVGAPLHVVAGNKGASGGLAFRGIEWPMAMRGEHQRSNAALALSVALDVAGLSPDECLEAMASAQMPARFQEVTPRVYADVAHNPAKTEALAATIGEELPGRSVILVVGIVEKKDHAAVLAPLAGVVSGAVFTRSRYRGADPGLLKDLWEGLGPAGPSEVVDGPREALARARELAGDEGVVVITGSTFVIDEVFNPEAGLLEANALYKPPGEAAEDRKSAPDA